MSRWLALAEETAKDMQTPPDNVTKPDKTPSAQSEGAFCLVLSNCQTGGESESPALELASIADDMRHGFAFGGHPKTWTGNIVSLNQWRRLSEWEKHGPDGRHWNGITKQWEAAK